MALSTPQYFIARYFADGHIITGQQDFQAEWYGFADMFQRLLLLAPRDHAKTTNLAIWYPIWRLCKWRWAKRRNPHINDPRIGVLSNTEGQAEGNLRAITQYLEGEIKGSEKLIEDFGVFKPTNPRKWTTLELIVEGWHASNAKDTTFFAGGYGSAWLGRRLDLLVDDDLADLKLNSGTDDARSALQQWFKEVITNCLEKESQAIMIGTMQHHKDLYNTIIHEEIERRKTGQPKVWDVRKYRAVIRDETPTTPAVVLWPDKNPYDHLMKRKAEIGTAIFEKQYQNIAVNEDLLVFKGAFLDKCLDRGTVMGEQGVLEGEQIYIGVDPASGESGLSKFFVMVALGMIKGENKLRIIDVFRDKISVTAQLKWLEKWWRMYHPNLIIIETNAYQMALKQILTRDYPFIRVQGQFTGKNKIDPEIGIVATMSPIVENGLLRIPYGDAMSQRVADRLTDELKLWPEGEYTDQVMALWIACTAARDMARRPKSQTGIWGQSVHNPAYPVKLIPQKGSAYYQDLEPAPPAAPVIDLTQRGRLFTPSRTDRS